MYGISVAFLEGAKDFSVGYSSIFSHQTILNVKSLRACGKHDVQLLILPQISTMDDSVLLRSSCLTG
ncbi:hypothetical protein Plhal304r1_c024g0083271 [Plasmopara halstedii]